MSMNDDDISRLIARAASEAADRSVLEMRRQFEIVAERIDSTVQTVAEGVAANQELVDRMRREMTGEFEETRSMIRLSYTELDRRLRSLESRVDHIESRLSQ